METWKWVPGYETKYQVSDEGRVKSFVLYSAGKLLKPGKGSHGYFTVTFTDRKSRTIHSLVMLAFKGATPQGMQILHTDGNRTNSSLRNLRFGTQTENNHDMDRHGTRIRGMKYPNAKLSDWKVKVIRRLRFSSSQRELACYFEVSPAAIQAVLDCRTWTHV